MYFEHFGLKEYPFSITPDTSFFFASNSSEEALNTLLIAARTGEGFIKVTGEVGTGKTLLCRKLLHALEDEFKVAYIPNPYLEPQALFKELASELGVSLPPEEVKDQHDLLKALTRAMMQIVSDGKHIAIILDEAQAMPLETLEALRLLTNLETAKRKLVQVIIFGQPELEDKLNHPSIRQLKQRIAFDYQLKPLTRNELDYYVHHRLVVAGYQGGRLFTAPALRLLHWRTKRVPRLVNILSHKAMLCAYGKGHRQVTFFDVLAAAEDTTSMRSRRWPTYAGIGVLILLGTGWVYLQ